MANTYIKIATVTVGVGGQASMAFSSIPATYTDLLLKVSCRTGRAATNDALYIQFNGSSTGYSNKDFVADNGATASYTSLFGVGYSIEAQGNSTTASVFSSSDIYIPNYTSANNKSFAADTVTENNATDVKLECAALLWSNTAAITSISLTNNSATNFAQYSTATLYGIKSS